MPVPWPAPVLDAAPPDEVDYRWLFEHSLDGVLLTTSDGGILAANPAICRMLGYTLAELREIGRAGVVDTADPRLPAAIEERRRTGRFVGELTLIAKDGRRVAVEVSSQVIRDQFGQELTSMLVRDISDRVRAEQERRLTEDRFRIALRNSPVIVYTVDTEQRYTWLYDPRSSYNADDVVGKRDTDIVPAEDVRELVSLRQQVLDTGRGVRREIRIRVRGEDRVYDVSAEPMQDAEGTVSGVTVAATDITENRRTEQQQRFLATAGELLAKSLEYESTIERIAHLAVPILGDACILDVHVDDTPRLLAVAHVDPRAEPGLRAMHERFPPSYEGARPLAVVRRTGEPMLLASLDEQVLDAISMSQEHRKSIAQLHARSALVVPLVASGRVLGVLTSFSLRRALGEQDLSIAVELARRAALAIDNAHAYGESRRASQTRDEVLGIVSHDLRNAIGTIAMSADLLESETDRTEVVRLTERIARATGWMRHIINDLLDVTAMEAGRLSVHAEPSAVSSIAETIRSLFESRAQSRGIELRVLCSRMPPFSGDAERIIQAVGNFVENAIKFTPAGGVVTFAVEPHEEGIAFRVSDTGVGIPPEDIPHIFDRFWQAKKTRRGGAGLGLAIAKGIADAHGGRIDVASEPGQGTTFTLLVPTPM